METTPIRHSERTAGRKFKFADFSSEDDPDGSDADISEEIAKKTNKHNRAVLGIDSEDATEKNGSPKQILSSLHAVTKSKKLSKSTTAVTSYKEGLHNNHGSLVQATISTLFKKVEEKNAPSSSRKLSASKASGQKLQHNDLKQNIDQAEVPRKKGKVMKEKSPGTREQAKKKVYKVEDDDIEEFSSSSQEVTGSDEDWAA